MQSSPKKYIPILKANMISKRTKFHWFHQTEEAGQTQIPQNFEVNSWAFTGRLKFHDIYVSFMYVFALTLSQVAHTQHSSKYKPDKCAIVQCKVIF